MVGVAVDETVILLNPLSNHIETPTKGRGGCSRMTVSSMARSGRVSEMLGRMDGLSTAVEGCRSMATAQGRDGGSGFDQAVEEEVRQIEAQLQGAKAELLNERKRRVRAEQRAEAAEAASETTAAAAAPAAGPASSGSDEVRSHPGLKLKIPA